jgi:hypothetical protein
MLVLSESHAVECYPHRPSAWRGHRGSVSSQLPSVTSPVEFIPPDSHGVVPGLSSVARGNHPFSGG